MDHSSGKVNTPVATRRTSLKAAAAAKRAKVTTGTSHSRVRAKTTPTNFGRVCSKQRGSDLTHLHDASCAHGSDACVDEVMKVTSLDDDGDSKTF